MSFDECDDMQPSDLFRSMLPLLVLGFLGVGVGCAGPSYKDTHTHIEASGERNAAALRLVRNPADMHHAYTCRKEEDKIVCKKACGSGQIRCPAGEVTVNGATYRGIGSPGTIPNTVSPEARQPKGSSGAAQSESPMGGDGSMESESDSGAAESDTMGSGDEGDMTGQDDEMNSGDSGDMTGQDDDKQQGGDR
jgi:hypothetical protein